MCRPYIDTNNPGRHMRQIKAQNIKSVCVASPLKHAALMSKSKDWLARNQNNVSEGGDSKNYIDQ
jgi:ABC-type phosphate transport system ATPase subunit